MFLSRYLFVLSLVYCFVVQHAYTQDMAVYSKYSESLNKSIKANIEKLTLADIQKALELEHTKPSVENYEKFKDQQFNFSINAEQSQIFKVYKDNFAEKVAQLEKGSETEILAILLRLKDQIKVDFKEKRTELLKPLLEAVESLQKESRLNASAAKKMSAASIKDVKQYSKDLVKNIEKSGISVVSVIQDGVVEEIKKKAIELATQKAASEFPDLNMTTLKSEAEAKFKYFKVGDNIKVRYAPTPNRVLTASGPIRTLDSQRVKIGFNTLSIKDIIDPRQRMAMSKSETFKSREAYIKERVSAQKSARLKYLNNNVQGEVDVLVSENEKKGYILNLGTWKTVEQVIATSLQSKVTELKKDGLEEFETAALAHSQTISSMSQSKRDFSEVLTKLRDKIMQELESDSVIAKAQAEQSALEISEKQVEEALAKELADKEEARKALEAQKLQEKQEREAAILAKKQAINNQTVKAEESDSSILIIALAVAAICLFGLVAFNKKVHDKILGNKKQSMMDIVNQDAIAVQQQNQASKPEIQVGGPRGNMAPKPIPVPSKQPAQVDVDISVESKGADQEKVVDRKKISLNLKGSTTSLEKDLIAPSISTPPGGGLTPPKAGLTPPGGGLTPPKAGLTPPGQNVDKSNLILNPNLQADGEKLQLKK